MKICSETGGSLLLSLFAVATLLATGPLVAQNSFSLDMLGQGEIMVNLSANEQTQVEQDTLHAALFYSAQGRDRIAIQDEVNRRMAEVQALLETADVANVSADENGGEGSNENVVESSIQQYYVHQVQPNRPTRNGDNTLWRARQGVQLSSQDSAAVLELVAELQSMGLTMSGLNYSLSADRQQQVADTLMAAALARLQARAEAAAAALGKSGVEMIEITMNSSGGGGYYRGMTTAMAMESSMDVATPVAEPGETTVSFNVSARAILLP